jgi:hypothetical protein
MGDIIHLGKIRKARERAAEKARADANAVRHGRTRAERERDAALRTREREAVDGARLEAPAAEILESPQETAGPDPDEPG